MVIPGKMQKWIISYALGVIAIFALLAIAYETIAYFDGFRLLKVAEANIVHIALSIQYPGIILNGNLLSNLPLNGIYSEFGIAIDDICLGFFPIISFCAMILALPKAKVEKKIKSLAIAIPVLFAANLIRIIASVYAGAWFGIQGFDLFHYSLMKFDLTIVVILMFLISIKFIFGKKKYLIR